MDLRRLGIRILIRMVLQGKLPVCAANRVFASIMRNVQNGIRIKRLHRVHVTSRVRQQKQENCPEKDQVVFESLVDHRHVGLQGAGRRRRCLAPQLGFGHLKAERFEVSVGATGSSATQPTQYSTFPLHAPHLSTYKGCIRPTLSCKGFAFKRYSV